MARIKGAMATRKRRKKVLKAAKGYYGSKHTLFKTAKQAVMKSGQYAYIGRKQKKRDFRRIWITRISAAAKMNGTDSRKQASTLTERCSLRLLFPTLWDLLLSLRLQRLLSNLIIQICTTAFVVVLFLLQ